jgi:hypothetical protein
MRTLVLALAFGSAIAFAQPDPKPNGPPKKEAWADPPAHTEFPELRVATVKESEKLIADLKANYPRPIPAAGTPLEKVRTAQLNEGVAFIVKFKMLIDAGAYRPEEYGSFIDAIGSTCRVEAELSAGPKAKLAAAEHRVRLMSLLEEFARRRVESGTDPSRQLNRARFERLQAEAELLVLKEQLAKEKGK